MADREAAKDWLVGGRRSEVSKERIVGAAADLVRENGFGSLDIDEVAAKAGCSRATLYRHVGGKAALAAAVVEAVNTSVLQQIATSIAGHEGAQLVVEVILAAVGALRAESIVTDVIKQGRDSETLPRITAPEVLTLALSVCGLDPNDVLAGHLIMRTALSLLSYPMGDRATERTYIERLIKPAFLAA